MASHYFILVICIRERDCLLSERRLGLSWMFPAKILTRYVPCTCAQVCSCSWSSLAPLLCLFVFFSLPVAPLPGWAHSCANPVRRWSEQWLICALSCFMTNRGFSVLCRPWWTAAIWTVWHQSKQRYAYTNIHTLFLDYFYWSLPPFHRSDLPPIGDSMAWSWPCEQKPPQEK